MTDREPGRGAARRTYLLALALVSSAALVCPFAWWTPPLPAEVDRSVVAGVLALAFLLGEQLLMHVEFRGDAYSFTLAGIPLIIGLLVAPLPDVVVARIIGAGLALILQRVGAEKFAYNCSVYAFETAVDGLALHQLLGTHAHLDLSTAAIVFAVVVSCDQLMSVLVLLVIRWHGGSMSGPEIRGVLVPAFVLAVVSTTVSLAVLLLSGGALGLTIIGISAAILVVVYRSYVATTRRHQRLELMHDFVNGGVGAESLDDVAKELLARIRALLRANTAEVLLVLDLAAAPAGPVPSFAGETVVADGQPGRPAQRVTRITDDDDGFVVEHEDAVLDWTAVRALDEAEPLLAPRGSKDRAVRRWLTERGYRDAIVVPLPASSGFVGILTVSDRLGETATFTADDLTLLQTLTGHLAVAGGSARLVEQLAYDATHDALTGLANRAQLARQIAVPKVAPDATACVLLLDLDRFKEVNDGLGHAAGDQLLSVVGQRLAAFLPPEATVARLGGDEFAALLPDLPGGDAAARDFGARLAAELARPVTVYEALLVPDVSIGIALAGPYAPTDDLLRQADTAMYAAKANDSTVALYQPDMDRGRIENLALLADLRLALREHPEQIAVYYQPKMDLLTQQIVSAEALVRWNHPTLGVLSPDRFIPLAETTGLINQFTPLVLRAALAQCRRWAEDGHPISVAVNLSARNMGDVTLTQQITAALRDAGVPASRLILEITESSIIDDPVQSLEILRELASHGITISLDDFGTGYSSLSYLQRLPVQEVKVDRSFVQGLTSDDPRPSRVLIASIAGLGANLGLRVVAEGAETQSVLTELHQLGCHVVQGYYIARPAPGDAFARWLRDRPAVAATASNGQLLSLVAN